MCVSNKSGIFALYSKNNMTKKELRFLDEVIADVQKGDDDIEPIMRMYSQFRKWFEEQR